MAMCASPYAIENGCPCIPDGYTKVCLYFLASVELITSQGKKCYRS